MEKLTKEMIALLKSEKEEYDYFKKSVAELKDDDYVKEHHWDFYVRADRRRERINHYECLIEKMEKKYGDLWHQLEEQTKSTKATKEIKEEKRTTKALELEQQQKKGHNQLKQSERNSTTKEKEK